MQNIVVVTYDGKSYNGKTINIDEESDLVLVKIEANCLKAATLEASGDLEVGEKVAEIGTPISFVLNPKRPQTKVMLVERLNQRVGEKAMVAVRDEVMNQDKMTHPWTIGKTAAYLFATVIHCFTLFCFYQVFFRLANPHTMGDILLGLIFAFISFHFLPRFGKIPKQLLDRNQ